MIDIEHKIQNNYLYVNKKEWARLCNNYNKKDIIEALSNLIDLNNIPIPYRQITELEAYADFLDLCALNTNLLTIHNTFKTRHIYKYVIDPLLIKASKVGNKASDYFHQKQRYCCDSINGPSPYRSWNDNKLRAVLLKTLLRLDIKEINPRTLRTCIALGRNVASQFKPSAAKAIYEMFNAKKILDFSAGWGDRLCAFHSCKNTKYYLGIDPNDKLIEGYLKQNEFYNTTKSVELINAPAEDAAIPCNYFDMVFSSPPYYNIEKYSKEPTQSYIRYPKLMDWLENFLFTVIEKSCKALKRQGYLIINISDVYSNHTVHKICDPMNDFIKDLGNMQYVKCMGMQMSKRPNTNLSKESIFAEPLWIWQKK